MSIALVTIKQFVITFLNKCFFLFSLTTNMYTIINRDKPFGIFRNTCEFLDFYT